MPFDDFRRRGPERGPGERAINLPPAILWLIGINIAVQVVRLMVDAQLDDEIVLGLGLVPAAYTSDIGAGLPALIAAPFTYQFIHGGWVHLGINMLSLAAFGAPVERLLGSRRFVVFYLSAGMVAGLVHVLSYPDSADPVVGASGAVSGVFGAVLMMMRRVGNLPSLLPVAGIWIGINVFFGLFGGAPGSDGTPVAWVAHIGGFVYGLLAIRLFAPPDPD
ncbi:MAG: rhomboid family intramembrane serine protease [Enhydrobacter sp.]|nr:MAG: rhomboid family intramembrane serine protease [Enhydrobacter sp.]